MSHPILRQAGFDPRMLAVAHAIAQAESGGRAKAFNPNASTGDLSYGLFQINMLGGLGPARRKQYGLTNNEQLFDPLTNAKIAYQLSKGGTDWSPWSAYKSGAYKKYLGNQKELANYVANDRAIASPQSLDRRQALLQYVMASNNALLQGQQQPSITPFLMSSRTPLGGSESLSNALPQSFQAQTSGNVLMAKGADRPGASTQQPIIDFAARVAGIYGRPLRITTGTSHNRFVKGTNRESAHWQGNAADIAASGASLTQMGQAALIAAGADPSWARKQKGGLFNIGGQQVIFNTNEGGNHYNHLHIGIRR